MVLTVEVTATNIAGSASALSAPVTITNPLPIPTTWVTRSSGTAQNLSAVGASSNEIIAIANNATPDMRRSLDGIAWSSITGHSVGQNATDVRYGGGVFLITAGGTVAANKIRRSTDGGLTWTASPHPVTGSDVVYGTAFGPGVIVAIAITGAKSLRSLDGGLTFVAATTGITFNPTSVEFGGGVFVATGLSGEIATSPDGDVWTNRTSAITTQINKVRYGDGNFIAVAGGGQIASSPDGSTWTRRDIAGVTGAWSGIHFNGGVWLIIGTSNQGQYSTNNGVTWTATPVNGVAADHIAGKWVVVGSGGVIMTSTY